jgi:hypothetical protein
MKKLSLILITIVLITCHSKNCEEIPQEFYSYEQAINEIQNSSFQFHGTSSKSSSWITNANYYSCDLKTGFLIIETSNKDYVHHDVPIVIWKEFNNSSSLGKYYNQNIKGRYQLHLKK